MDTMITAYGGAVDPPGGWLICDGRTASRTTYAALFQVIGTTHGAGNGSTTFNLPAAQGLVLRGTGRTKVGPALGAVQEDHFQGHRHRYNGFPGGAQNISGSGSTQRRATTADTT